MHILRVLCDCGEIYHNSRAISMYNVPFLKKTGLFTSIDIRFAGFMAALANTDDPAVIVGSCIGQPQHPQWRRVPRFGGLCRGKN